MPKTENSLTSEIWMYYAKTFKQKIESFWTTRMFCNAKWTYRRRWERSNHIKVLYGNLLLKSRLPFAWHAILWVDEPVFWPLKIRPAYIKILIRWFFFFCFILFFQRCLLSLLFLYSKWNGKVKTSPVTHISCTTTVTTTYSSSSNENLMQSTGHIRD